MYDLKGRRVGFWTVIHRLRNGKWKCRCICGVEREVRTDMLVGEQGQRNQSRSCGCKRHELRARTMNSYRYKKERGKI